MITVPHTAFFTAHGDGHHEDADYTVISRKKGQNKKKDEKEEAPAAQPQQQQPPKAVVEKPFYKTDVPAPTPADQKPKKNKPPRQRRQQEGVEGQQPQADTQPQGEQPQTERKPRVKREFTGDNGTGSPREPREPRQFVPIVPPAGTFEPASVDELLDSITNYYSKQDAAKPDKKKQPGARAPKPAVAQDQNLLPLETVA
jgi:hypothetical protein